MNWLTEPWPWYVAGPLIGLTVPLLYLLDNKRFGISSSLQHMCALAGSKVFKYDWRKQQWNLWFAGGVLLGAVVAGVLLPNAHDPQLNAKTVQELSAHGVDVAGFAPRGWFSAQLFSDPKALAFMFSGGLLVGFGSRYAAGCTSGHAISGLSALQLPSLVATIGFFVGGLVSSWWILPHILEWLK